MPSPPFVTVQKSGRAKTRPTTFEARFVSNGSSNPVEADNFGSVKSITRLIEGAIPFWRVVMADRYPLTKKSTLFQFQVNGVANAVFDGVAQVVRDGLTADVGGVIAANAKATTFDVVLLVAGTPVDTAGASIEIRVSYEAY